jgi:hypothetical protein
MVYLSFRVPEPNSFVIWRYCNRSTYSLQDSFAGDYPEVVGDSSLSFHASLHLYALPVASRGTEKMLSLR